jgi:hypothetical protein
VAKDIPGRPRAELLPHRDNNLFPQHVHQPKTRPRKLQNRLRRIPKNDADHNVQGRGSILTAPGVLGAHKLHDREQQHQIHKIDPQIHPPRKRSRPIPVQRHHK